jgi:hypothetical protein
MIRLVKVLLVLVPLVVALTLLSEHLDRVHNHGLVGALLVLPLLLGYLGYMITTGDMHGWQPGPIGYAGRVALVSVFNILFWSLVFFRLTKSRHRA